MFINIAKIIASEIGVLFQNMSVKVKLLNEYFF